MSDVNCELCGLPGVYLVEARGISVYLCDDCLGEIEALTGDRQVSNSYGYERRDSSAAGPGRAKSDESLDQTDLDIGSKNRA